MSAGTGVRHSEFNGSRKSAVHFLQIWIVPAARGTAPRYGQKPFPEAERRGRLRVVASPDARDGSLPIGQDALVFASLLDPGAEVRHALAPGRGAWLQVARGAVAVNGKALAAGDGAAIESEPGPELRIVASEPSELLLFDLA
jgi:redox-sensitive bicupin YhaK (pirin superfamily)